MRRLGIPGPRKAAALLVAALTVAALPLAGTARGAALDEMKPQLLEELEVLKKSIQAGDVPAALESNQMIDAWLRQVQASDVTAVFLDVPGWDREAGEAQSAGQAFFGGGISANCTWTKGDERVTVNILGNSPMFGMVSGMMGMAVASGKKVQRVAGHKAILDDKNGKAELQIPFEGNTLVSVDGSSVDAAVLIAEKGIGWESLGAAVKTE